MSIFSDIGKFVPGALSLFDAYNQNQGRNQYGDAVKNQIEADYNAQRDKYNYDLNYNQQVQQANAANAAASRQAAGARAAAAAQTEKNRQAAAKKAQKTLDASYGQMREAYQPFADTARRLLPQKENTYSNALGGMNLLQAYLMQPDQLAHLNNNPLAQKVQIPIDSYFAGAKK